MKYVILISIVLILGACGRRAPNVLERCQMIPAPDYCGQ